MKRIVDKAIVLRRVNYGDSDRVLTLLTESHGKVTAFAKGVRKPKSKLSGGIELLSLSEVSLIEGKSDMMTLTGSTLIHYYDGIIKDLDKTNQAFDVLKKVMKLSDDGAGQEFFLILNNYLECLASKDYEPKIVQVWANLRLLGVSGLLSDIEAKGDGEIYRFDYDKQVFLSHDNGDFTKNDIKLLRILGKNKKPIKLDNELRSADFLLNFSKTLYSQNFSN